MDQFLLFEGNFTPFYIETKKCFGYADDNNFFLDHCNYLFHHGIYADEYNHQVVDNGNANQKDYFHIIANDFTRDLNQGFEIDALNSDFDLQRAIWRQNVGTNFKTLVSIGFSNGYTNHNDAKWEIVAGGYLGTEFVIRNGNAGSPILAVHSTYPNTSQWEQVRNHFAVQVTDGNIALYETDSDGVKGDVIVEWNDDSIVKSELNTLTVSGGYGGTGVVRVRGVCANWIQKQCISWHDHVIFKKIITYLFIFHMNQKFRFFAKIQRIKHLNFFEISDSCGKFGGYNARISLESPYLLLQGEITAK